MQRELEWAGRGLGAPPCKQTARALQLAGLLGNPEDLGAVKIPVKLRLAGRRHMYAVSRHHLMVATRILEE